MILLAGDIGGTNARLIIKSINDGNEQVIAEKSYSCADHKDLYSIIDIFIADDGIALPVDAVCLAIAGPVENGVAKVTNLPWVISEQELRHLLQTEKVKLVNDLVAAAHGVSQLEATDMCILQQGEKSDLAQEANAAVIIAVGTGLGASHLACQSEYCQAFSSEAGHTGFAPANELQQKLLAFLRKDNAHVSVEMLLSGKGIVNIYRFLCEELDYEQSSKIISLMKKTDPAQVITEQALAGEDTLCIETLALFIDIFGAVAGDIVLHHYPVNTLYIGGGISAKIKQAIQAPAFLTALHNKGLMTANMKKIAVKLITQEKLGLYGAVFLAEQLSKQ